MDVQGTEALVHPYVCRASSRQGRTGRGIFMQELKAFVLKKQSRFSDAFFRNPNCDGSIKIIIYFMWTLLVIVK